MRRFLVSIVFAATGCATQVPVRPDGVEPLSQPAYAALVKSYTFGANHYSGFYQTFQADMTELSTAVQTAALKQKAYYQQWDQKKFQNEREKVMQASTAYAKFFMRFFSPERDYDDLQKEKTAWKIYLDFNGQRFEGKVKRLKEKFVELQNEFPHFDRFSTPYEVQFNVPMTTVETQAAKVTLTSSLGTAEFDFPGRK